MFFVLMLEPLSSAESLGYMFDCQSVKGVRPEEYVNVTNIIGFC